MSSRTVRMMLWSGFLGSIILFAGDMLFYGGWGANGDLRRMMASAALWRLHLGSLTGPLGMAFVLPSAVGLWYCHRGTFPRLAGLMLGSFYLLYLSGLLQHGIFGPLGFVLQDSGPNSQAFAQILTLNRTLVA